MEKQKTSLSIEMPGVDFGEMAREAIAGKLIEALVGADAAIAGIVAKAMTTKVNEHGAVGSYGNNTPFVEWLAQDLIRAAAKDVLAKKVEAMRPVIAAQIEAQLKRNVKSIAMSLTDAFAKQASAGYGVIINLTAKMRTKD